MKRSSRDEENVIRAHHAITSVHGRAFNDRKNVALHTFARNVWTMSGFTPVNLVDLVEEDDAGALDTLDRRPCNLVHVDETLFLFLHQVLHRLIDAHLASLR